MADAPHRGSSSPEVERLRRLYAALRQINRAIVVARTRDDLFAGICAALVERGGFRMAWIGWHDPATHRLEPVSQTGDESGYLRTILVATDDRPEGHGPSGMAFREDRAYVCNDLFADPATLPWRPELARRGLRSSVALPFHRGGAVCGTLSVYSDALDFFQEEELQLLIEAAADVSFALDHLAQEEERRRAEDEIKRLVAIVESTDDAIMGHTLAGTLTSWNPAAQAMFGYRSAEILGRSVELLIPADRTDEEAAILRRIAGGEHVVQLETVRVRRDGTRFPVSITVSPILGMQAAGATAPAVVGVSKVVRDITERKRAEALAERESRFASGLIEAMPGIFYLYDEQRRFLRWNQNFERVSGYSAEEIGQMQPLDFFAGADRPLLARRIGDTFEHGQASVEAAFVAKDGSTTPYFFTGKRITLDGGPCLIGVGVDVAEKVRAEEALRKSEERFRSTLDNILEGCQLIDFDWRYLYLNGAAAVQNRRPNTELLGCTMPDAWPGIGETPVFALLQRCLRERVPAHEEILFTFPDGVTAWFDLRVQPVPEGIFLLSIDISERKRAERALRDLNESLERKVAERTHDLTVARERAEAADHLKSAFLATMSHELRTPLNSIIGFTGIILQGLAGPLNAEQAKQLGMVRTSARHLLDLINDVLDLSKIEAGQLEVRAAPFELGAAVERVIASVTPLAEKKGLALRVAVPPTLAPMVSDQRRVEQILLNLLNNAIKFTERGEVTLGVDLVDSPGPAEAHGPPMARLQVTDTGIGMREEDLSKLFQPFRQIDSGLQRHHEGTGLGLAICRRLTGLLGGTISAASVWGQGSVFTVVLPVRSELTG